jgi:hypothetical protein
MSVVQQDTAMPCAFEEEFVDFESAAAQYSISSCAAEEWAMSELDDEALGIGSRPASSTSIRSTPPASTTGWDICLYYPCTLFSYLPVYLRRVFQIELYNFGSLYKFIQRTCTVF